jgi:O-6-methylguanine DNA methyltransferase
MKQLNSSYLDTPLGTMIAIADESALYLLQFVDHKNLEQKIEKLRLKTESTIVPGSTHPIALVTTELQSYFSGNLKEFKTPLHLTGTPFQNSAWQELMNIAYGTTQNYADQANAIGKQSAHRAVANANSANNIIIIIPCHRIIQSNGSLGGYSATIARKQWLIEHEKKNLI